MNDSCIRAIILATAVGLLDAQAGSPQETLAGTTNSKPLVTLFGQYSGVKQPRILRIYSDREWQALWADHKPNASKGRAGDLDRANLDFDKVMAVAVFQGEGVFLSGYDVGSIREDRRGIIVRVRPLTFQLGPTSNVELIGSQAWGIFVLPRSDKELTVELGERVMITSPFEWVKVKTFPAVMPERLR